MVGDVMSFDDNRKQGFIVIYRSLLEWEWFQDSNTLHVFIYCLLKANHKDKRYKGDLIKKGSFYTSREIIANDTGLSVQNVRTSLEHLKLTNELTIETSQKGTIITVNNYDVYQKSTSKLTNNQPTANQQLTTNNNDNNENNGGAHQYTADFLEFYESYRKAGFKDDCFDYWLEMEYTEEEKKHIVYASKEYSKEMKDDVRHMVFPRTFLKDEMWKRYEYVDEDDWRKRQQEQLEYMRSMGVEK